MSVPVQQGPHLVTVPTQGSQLVMPLRRLEQPAPGAAPVVPRPLHREPLAAAELASWGLRVRRASEACLLVDDQGGVAAMSSGCGLLLDVEPVCTVGVLLLDLVVLVDFSAAAVPLPDPELQMPPLRALRGGGMARALIRLRDPAGVLTTYDVVGVPLAGGAGALAFLTEV